MRITVDQQDASLLSVVKMLAGKFHDLLELRDADGRKAYVVGTEHARRAMHDIAAPAALAFVVV